MKNIPYKTACTNDLPDDEHMMFETYFGPPRIEKNFNFQVYILFVHVTHKIFLVIN